MTIEELKHALEAATPGPWVTATDPSHYDSHSEIYRVEDGEFVASTGGKWDTLEANARLIVEAVNNLPKLLKVVEAAQTMLDAIDKGAVDSEEIVPVPGDGPPHRFHEEWAHHTRKALEELGK